MTEKFDYDSRIYIGASDEDIKIIHLALVDGKRLTMDTRGRIYDESGRWIADAIERKNRDIGGIKYA